MKKARFIVQVFLLVVASLSGAVIAQSEVEIPEVSGVVTDAGIEFPNEISAGLVTLTFENQRTEAPYGPVIARLNEGVTVDSFFETMASGDEMAPVFMLTLYGGMEIPVGESLSFTTELPEGEYLILEFAETQSMPHIFTVVENDMEQPDVPESDVTVAMVDFAFGIPARIEAGPQIWELRNFGEQWHEAAIMRLDEDLSLSEVLDALSSTTPGEPGPYESVFFWTPIGAEVTSWVTVDLEPGHYVIACFLPDINGDFTSHLMKGMVAVFTVE
jgi:hypothetical protein